MSIIRYVRSDGNDSNPGNLNTPEGAWLTIAKALTGGMNFYVVNVDGTIYDEASYYYLLEGFTGLIIEGIPREVDGELEYPKLTVRFNNKSAGTEFRYLHFVKNNGANNYTNAFIYNNGTGGSNAVIDRCVFDVQSGSVKGILVENSGCSVDHCVFYACYDGILHTAGSVPTVKNSVYYGCTNTDHPNWNYDFYYSQVDYNLHYDSTSKGLVGPHSIEDEDPVFANVAASVFNIRSTSPCIDAGEDGSEDIGAYEWSGNPDPDPGLAPVAAFSADVTSGDAPLTVTFTDVSTNTPTAWEWDFGDGSAHSSEQSPSHEYFSAGTYTVTLTAFNAVGSDEEEKVDYITVSDPSPSGYPPVAAFSASPLGGVAPKTISFTDESTNTPTSWDWDFGDLTSHSTDQNPTHEYTVAGTYTVVLIVTNGYGDDTETKVGYITITPAAVIPVAAFSGFPTTIVKNHSVQFTDESTNYPTSWDWDFGDLTPHSTDQNPSHTYTLAGTYTVTLIATNGAGSDSEIKVGYITVNNTCAIHFMHICDFSIDPLTGEIPLEVTLSPDVFSIPPTTVLWAHVDWGDGSDEYITIPGPFDPLPTHIYTVGGLFTVVLTAQFDCGTQVIKTQTDYVSVGAGGLPPVADFSGTPTWGCDPKEITFTDASTNTPTAWEWDFGDGTDRVYTQNPTHEYVGAGTYTVVLKVRNDYGEDTLTRSSYITVYTGDPIAAFTVDDDSMRCGPVPLHVEFVNLTEGATTWDWDFGDGTPHSSLENPTHNYLTPGTYTVTLTVTTSCSSKVLECTGYIQANSEFLSPDFTVVPNEVTHYIVKTMDDGREYYDCTLVSQVIFVFADASSGSDLVSWLWDFGDGETSTEQNPQHMFPYTIDSSYKVTLTVTNGDGLSRTKKMWGDHYLIKVAGE